VRFDDQQQRTAEVLGRSGEFHGDSMVARELAPGDPSEASVSNHVEVVVNRVAIRAEPILNAGVLGQCDQCIGGSIVALGPQIVAAADPGAIDLLARHVQLQRLGAQRSSPRDQRLTRLTNLASSQSIGSRTAAWGDDAGGQVPAFPGRVAYFFQFRASIRSGYDAAIAMASQDHAREARIAPQVGGRYAKYVLVVLVLVNVFNFLDRQLITVLANDVRADLGLTDAEIGFLYGTAFAVFYAVFGIPLGKVADVWDRRGLISIGLAFWSAMTAISGFAWNFGVLAAARIGVGVGEASASPAAFSMLADYFPPRRRTTALSVYASGVYIGAGVGVFLGGWILDLWNAAYPPDLGQAPFGLRGWQVAFFAVGLPGLLMALWVRTLQEPVSGMSEGLVAVAPRAERPVAAFWRELKGLLPGFSLVTLAREETGAGVIGVNLKGLAVITAVAGALIAAVGTPLQWIALGAGIYAAFSWAQGLALRDPPSFQLIYRSRAMVYSAIGFSLLAFTGYGVGAFAPAFFMRFHEASASEVGTVVGLTAAVAGWIGVTAGGLLADALKLRTRNARLHVGLIAATVPVPLALWMLATESTLLAYVLNFPLTVAGSMWVGAAAATVQDLVLPRMRAVASANYILCVTFIGLALGPYTIGRMSDWFDNLRAAMMLAFAVNAVAVGFLLAALRHLARDEDSRFDRARLAGEPTEAVAQASGAS